MAEIEKSVPVCARLCYVEVRTDQRNEERVKEPVSELEKYLRTFFHVRLGYFCVDFFVGWAQPSYVRDLGSINMTSSSTRGIHT
jgi:hypothetical protein